MEHLQPPETVANPSVSPEDIEQWLVAQVAASCDVPPQEIGIDAPLTSLGLESLTLFTVAGDLASWLDRDIPATVLWEYPSIREVARYLWESGQPQSETDESPRQHASPLVAIQPKGDLPPLFCVHDLSGGLWCYTAMMRSMDAQQPMYGFQIPVAENENFEIPPLEELAAYYVEALRHKFPEGPYRLAGYSMGGVIAYEMARQLRAAGQEIAFLGLLDSQVSNLKQSEPSNARLRFVHWRLFFSLGARDKLLYLLEEKAPWVLRSFYFHSRHLQPLGWGEKMRYLRHLLLRKATAPVPASTSELQRFRELLLESNVPEQLMKIAVHYNPPVCDEDITLFRARWQWDGNRQSRAWKRVMGKDIREIYSPGSHTTLTMEPNARELAAHLTRCLREARGS